MNNYSVLKKKEQNRVIWTGFLERKFERKLVKMLIVYCVSKITFTRGYKYLYYS